MNKVIIRCGASIEHKCRGQLHPVNEVKKAEEIIKAVASGSFTESAVFYSNSPDFVSAIKYIGIKQGVDTEFYLDDVSHGNDIEPIFTSFNEALDLVNELGTCELE